MKEVRCDQCEALVDVADQCYECLKAPPPKRKHCSHGHEYTAETLFFDPSGNRRCRTCENVRGLKYYTKQQAAKVASRSAA